MQIKRCISERTSPVSGDGLSWLGSSVMRKYPKANDGMWLEAAMAVLWIGLLLLGLWLIALTLGGCQVQDTMPPKVSHPAWDDQNVDWGAKPLRVYSESSDMIETLHAAADMINGQVCPGLVAISHDPYAAPVRAELADPGVLGCEGADGCSLYRKGLVFIHVKPRADGLEQLRTTVHELGHAFFLDHDFAGPSVMNPYGGKGPIRFAIHQRDALRARYCD